MHNTIYTEDVNYVLVTYKLLFSYTLLWSLDVCRCVYFVFGVLFSADWKI